MAVLQRADLDFANLPFAYQKTDVNVRYTWQEGTVPPPHYYQYTISAGPGADGSIDFLPDYPEEKPPVWTETFAVAEDVLDKLYALMARKEMLATRRWTEIDDGTIGGPLESIRITAGGRQYAVPSFIKEAAIVEDVYKAVNALVPESVWSILEARRQEYQRRYV